MKTEKGFKMFRMNGGKLYPLYVLADKETVIGEWLDAEDGPAVEETNGRRKVKSKLGKLAYRPGWHIADIPNSPWIGKKGENGELLRRKDCVWCEVEYPVDICYQEEARLAGYNKGKFSTQRAYLKHIPTDGYYRFRTNTNGDEWIIAGKMRVNRVLSNEEVAEICWSRGVVPQRVAA